MVGRAGFEFAELKVPVWLQLSCDTPVSALTGAYPSGCVLDRLVMPTLVVGVYSVSADETALVNTEALPS